MVRTGLEPTGTDLAGAGPFGAVCDVTPGIGSGGIFGIMGMSILARCLSRLPEPTAGEITFEGRDLLTRCEIQDDFDAAIRGSDRIAITKDGIVIQIGTPEELAIRPATDHVAEFTREVSRARYSRCASGCGRQSSGKAGETAAGHSGLRSRDPLRRARRRRVVTRRADAGRPDHRTDRPGPPLTAIVLTPSGAR